MNEWKTFALQMLVGTIMMAVFGIGIVTGVL